MTEGQMASYIERAERDGLDLDSWEPVAVIRDGKVGQAPRVVNVSLPDWLVRNLDAEAKASEYVSSCSSSKKME